MVAREHEETEGVATGRVISAMAAIEVRPGREEPVYRIRSAMAAIVDRIVAVLQPLRVIPFGEHP